MIYPSLRPLSNSLEGGNDSTSSTMSTSEVLLASKRESPPSAFSSSTTPRQESAVVGRELRQARSTRHHPSSRRRVSFNESKNKYVVDLPFSEDERRRASYTDADFLDFEADLAEALDQLSKDEQHQRFEDAINKLYAAAKEHEDITNPWELLDTSELSDFTREDYIGLESYLANRVIKDARGRQEFLQDVVYDVQNDYDFVLSSGVAEELKESCTSISRVGCLFAQMIAQIRHETSSSC